MSRGGAHKLDGPSERKCLATGNSSPKAGLIRFVTGPDGQVVPDILEKLPGRGYWVSASRKALQKAIDKRLFARGAKQQVTIPDGLLDQIESQLVRHVVDMISLARRSGRAVAGFEKVKDWLAKEQAAVLIQSSDGSERGKTKLRPPYGRDSHINWLTANEIGLAFGRENVIHGALASGGLCNRVVEEAIRLKGVREEDGGYAAGKVK